VSASWDSSVNVARVWFGLEDKKWPSSTNYFSGPFKIPPIACCERKSTEKLPSVKVITRLYLVRILRTGRALPPLIHAYLW